MTDEKIVKLRSEAVLLSERMREGTLFSLVDQAKMLWRLMKNQS
jgi:hypothetical protein